MNSKRSFFKKIFFLFFLTIFPFKSNQRTKNKKFLKRKFSKVWILTSDDI